MNLNEYNIAAITKSILSFYLAASFAITVIAWIAWHVHLHTRRPYLEELRTGFFVIYTILTVILGMILILVWGLS